VPEGRASAKLAAAWAWLVVLDIDRPPVRACGCAPPQAERAWLLAHALIPRRLPGNAVSARLCLGHRQSPRDFPTPRSLGAGRLAREREVTVGGRPAPPGLASDAKMHLLSAACRSIAGGTGVRTCSTMLRGPGVPACPIQSAFSCGLDAHSMLRGPGVPA